MSFIKYLDFKVKNQLNPSIERELRLPENTIKYLKRNNINLFDVDSDCNDRKWLSKKKVLILGGHEFIYFKNYLVTYGIDIYDTFEDDNPFDTMFDKEKNIKVWEFRPDYIILSQVSSFKKLIFKIAKDPFGNYKQEIKDQFNNFTLVLEKSQELYKEIPIFLMTYPYIDLCIFGSQNYRYQKTITLILLSLKLKIYKLTKKYQNLFIIDTDLVFEPFGKTPEIIRKELTGGHPEVKGGFLLAENFLKQITLLYPLRKNIECLMISDEILWKNFPTTEITNEEWTNPKDFISGIQVDKSVLENLYYLSLRGIVITIYAQKQETIYKNIIENVLKKSPGFYRNLVISQINTTSKEEKVRQISKYLKLPFKKIGLFEHNLIDKNLLKSKFPEITIYGEEGINNCMKITEFEKNLNENVFDNNKLNEIILKFNKYKRNYLRNKMFDDYLDKKLTYRKFLEDLNLTAKILIVESSADEEVKDNHNNKNNDKNNIIRKNLLDKIRHLFNGKVKNDILTNCYNFDDFNQTISLNNGLLILVELGDKFGIYEDINSSASNFIAGLFATYEEKGVLIKYFVLQENGKNLEFLLLKTLVDYLETHLNLNLNLSSNLNFQDIKMLVKSSPVNRKFIKNIKEFGFEIEDYDDYDKIILSLNDIKQEYLSINELFNDIEISTKKLEK